MTDRIAVNTDELRSIASRINTKRETIINVFAKEVLPVLKTSQECLLISGLSYDEVITSFKNLFNSLDNQLLELTTLLRDGIAQSYESTSDVIRRLFNSKFAEEMLKTLSIMNV